MKKKNTSRYGRDGANYTSRAIFDCYYNEMDNSSAILDYQPKRYLVVYNYRKRW